MPGFVDYVNPLQGTDSVRDFSHGNTLPLVTMPWGSTGWSLQNSTTHKWFFHPHERHIQGVRATHRATPWFGDYGHFTVMPQAGPLLPEASQRASSYDLSDTILRPHYLNVGLRRYQSRMELCPTERCAAMRFTFPTDADKRVLIDFFPGELHLELAPQGVIRGFTRANQGCSVPDNFALYFVIQVDHRGKQVIEGGENAVLAIEVDADTVEMQIGTSFISQEQAQCNLDREIGERDFGAVRATGNSTWNELLEQIEIDGATEDQKRTFYSCLYRTSLFPRVWHEFDANAKMIHYSPYDGQVHDGPMYADNGLWDVYRTLYPLLTILHPKRHAEIMEGWLNAYRQSGQLPKWPAPGHLECMIGSHIDVAFADAFAKGVELDWDLALEAILHNAKVGIDHPSSRRGMEEFVELGYVAADRTKESASRTMDFAYDDFCIAQVAKGVGKMEIHDRLIQRASNYRNLFDSSIGFTRARNADGTWVEPFSATEWGGPFVEGSAWQCGWAMQHDPAGLFQLLGGRENALAKFDELLETPPIFEVGSYQKEIHEMTEMAAVDFGQYAHSNQPSHHLLYFFALAGRASTTQRWVRRTMDELYNASPQGFCGDEDNGEMAAWYILNAMGFYPFCPGTAEYILGSPLFPKMTVHLESGDDLIIEAESQSPRHTYTAGCRLNDDVHERLYLRHDEIATGARVSFQMSDCPVDPLFRAENQPSSLTAW